MSEHHHQHHHHHREDDASRFKRKSLLSIQRRKVMEKYAFVALCVVAALMGLATILVYCVF